MLARPAHFGSHLLHRLHAVARWGLGFALGPHRPGCDRPTRNWNLSSTDLQDLEPVGETPDAELGKIRAETPKRGFRCRNQTPTQGPMLYAKSLAISCATQRPLTALREWLDGGYLKSRFIAPCKRRRLHWLSWFPMGSWRRYRPPAPLRFFGWNQNDWRMQSAFWPSKAGRGARKSHD
jgi:hypothetical protein